MSNQPKKAADLQASTALDVAEAEIALLTSYGTDTVYRLRYDSMKYDYLSPAIERLLGYTVAEFGQMNIRDVIEETRIVPNAMQKVLEFAPFEEARRKGEVMRWHADYKMRRKDGGFIWVSDVSHPWVDDEGTIIGSVGCLRDITERVEAETQFQEEMMRMANMDWLTGAYHRRFFFDRLDEEIRRVRRSRADLAVAIIDIDHFKNINDRHGHQAGDAVLQQVAARIKSCLRDTDILARVGGEEFAILLPETPLEGGYWVAERIRQAIAGEPMQLPDNAPLRVTVSIGVAEVDYEEPQDSTALYRTADTRLYIAKNTGRNQVSVDELLSLH
jgi:diguanylate cyclase (GGDEF)-like protein/PAS domain S-box-containing protein